MSGCFKVVGVVYEYRWFGGEREREREKDLSEKATSSLPDAFSASRCMCGGDGGDGDGGVWRRTREGKGREGKGGEGQGREGQGRSVSSNSYLHPSEALSWVELNLMD